MYAILRYSYHHSTLLRSTIICNAKTLNTRNKIKDKKKTLNNLQAYIYTHNINIIILILKMKEKKNILIH